MAAVLKKAKTLATIIKPSVRLAAASIESHVDKNILLCGPGPANMSKRVAKCGAMPLLGHMNPNYLELMDDCKEGLQYMFQTYNPYTLAVPGTGHAGMETALVNLLEPGDSILVALNGNFGVRCFSLAARMGLKPHAVHAPMGKVLHPQQIENEIKKHNPKVFFITHGESSSGFLQPLEEIGDICDKYNCLFLVDAVGSLGATPFHMDEWGIDVAYSAVEKVLGCPPSNAPISFNKQAVEMIRVRTTEPATFYFDLHELGNYWGCDGEPRRYHHTGMISSTYALREGLAMLCEETLEECWYRHQKNAERLWEGIEKLGLRLFVDDVEHRLPTVTTVEVPSDLKWKDVTDHMLHQHEIELGGGIGDTTGKVWRIGLMGPNSTQENVDKVLAALGDSIKAVRAEKESFVAGKPKSG